jgi:glycosyltransferase involved in cell wall biosynthesis
MNIGIDARFFGPVGKGLGRYTQKLIEHLERTDTENRYFVFIGKENFDDYHPQSKNFQKVLADCKWYTLREQFFMPHMLRKYDLDLVHFPHFNVPIFYFRPFVITIHDLILLHFPTVRSSTLGPLRYRLKFLAYKLTIFSAIKRARKIITVSEFTKKDILKHYDVEETKIAVTYEACEERMKNVKENDGIILEKYGIIKPYILYVGNAYPHKNLEALVNAFDLFCVQEKGVKLVLVGKEDYFYTRLKQYVKKRNIKNVVFPGFVDDSDLEVIYSQSLAYVFPSLYEGFGLPPLEAMEKGVPVASSDHACMKEILEDSAFFFDGKDEKKMTEALLRICNDEKLRTRLAKQGPLQAAKYSWSRMACQTQRIYADLCRGRAKKQ